MSDGVIEQMCIRLAQYPFERMRIVWHGGEPMLAGLHFYEKAVACQKKYLRNRRVINSIQTNGTLIDKQWCEFFKTNDFSVGVSLDGPRNLNTSRTYPNGLEAFDNIIRGVENLRKYGVKYGLLSVLDKKIIGQEQSFYDFVRSISDSIRLNFVVPYGLGEENVETISHEDLLELSKSLGVLYDLWKNDKSGERPFIVLPFAEMAQSLVNQNVNTCAFSEDGCQGVISISNDGSVYSCGRFSEDVDFLMGNIFDHSFNEILNSDVAKKRARRLCHIKAECSNCKYIKVCNGGCAQEAYAINNDYYKKTPYCSLYLSLFSKIEQDVNTMLALRKNL